LAGTKVNTVGHAGASCTLLPKGANVSGNEREFLPTVDVETGRNPSGCTVVSLFGPGASPRRMHWCGSLFVQALREEGLSSEPAALGVSLRPPEKCIEGKLPSDRPVYGRFHRLNADVGVQMKNRYHEGHRSMSRSHPKGKSIVLPVTRRRTCARSVASKLPSWVVPVPEQGHQA
jgi:hypothetical protein